MRCLFSSIAWTPEQAPEVARTLRTAGFAGIEGAPNLFDRPLAALEEAHIKAVRTFWEGEGLPICAMQALLFGKPELRLFGSDAERAALADYLRLVFRVAGQLGAGPLVFGSPRNRARGDMPFAAAFDIAVEFFRKLAPDAAAEGCTLCMEANAPDYGCDFITTHGEAADLVAAVNTNGFGLQMDAGVLCMNDEAPAVVLPAIQRKGFLPQHVHASRPFLTPVDGTDAFQAAVASALNSVGYSGFVSVEMKKPDSFTAVVEAAQSISALYGADI